MKKASVTFSEFELKAVFEALSNYTPKYKRWKQAAQTRSVRKVQLALWVLIHGRAPQ